MALGWLERNGKVLSYLVTVLAPSVVVSGYLFAVAAEQYHSRVAFAVRSLDTQPVTSVLGMLSQASNAGSEDALILTDFLKSQRIVELLQEKFPFESVYNHAAADQFYRLGEGRSIEDKISYWNFMTTVAYDSTSGTVEVEARAFSPEDARMIAAAVAEESESLVNALSERARIDAVRYAQRDVGEAEERLRALRIRLSKFRNESQEIDPTANAQLQLQLVASLESSLAAAETKMKSMRTYLGEDAPSVRVLQRQIDSLNEQIRRERGKLAGVKADGGPDTNLEQRVSQFEELKVSLEFAANLYTAALSSLSQAEAEARRTQRFLAVHIGPTTPEEALYPKRFLLSLAVFVALSLLWAIIRLIIISISERN